MAIIFALSIVVLVPLILGLFDVYTASEQRARLQDALDAAALYAARSDLQTDAEIDAAGDRALNANLRLLRGATLLASDFHLAQNNTKVTASATIQPMALAPAFWAHPAVTVTTDVVRNSKNLEVSLVLD
ncbi:MAG TPA: pilus assembly protein TadG-related protein, partial [Phenylobacterium sp.]